MTALSVQVQYNGKYVRMCVKFQGYSFSFNKLFQYGTSFSIYLLKCTVLWSYWNLVLLAGMLPLLRVLSHSCNMLSNMCVPMGNSKMKAEWNLCIVPVCEFMYRAWAICSKHPHHGTGWCTLTFKQLPVWLCCSDMLQMTRSCSVMSCLSHKTGRPKTSAQHSVEPWMTICTVCIKLTACHWYRICH
jgi:hypothetical protein